MKLICTLAVVLAVIANASAQTFLTNGLVAYYPFNGNVNDQSGNGNNGTGYNVVTTNGPGSGGASALSFNGQNSYAVIPNSASLNPTNLTLSLWVNLAAISGYELLYSKHEAGANSDGSWFMAISPGNSFYFGASGQTVNSQNVLPIGVWTHCVFTYSATNQLWTFYINGSSNISGNLNFNIRSNSWPLRLGTELQSGGSSQAYFFNGAMYSGRIYNRTLSSNEVAQLYNIELQQAPVLTQNLTNFSVLYGQNTTIGVTATSQTPINYQWYFAPAGYAGQAGAYAETVSHFVYGAVVTNGGYGYGGVPSISFVGGGGSGASGYATVANGAVTGVTVTNAGTGYTSVPGVVIDPPDGLLPGQTNSTLTVSNASPASYGNYYVVLSNATGSSTSSVVNLSLLYPPTIATNPVGFTQPYRSSGTLAVVAAGTPPFSYQWALNGTNVNGAVVSSFTISSLALSNTGPYTVVVASPYGSVTSSPAYVAMLPSLSSPFTGAIGLWGQDTTLNVGAVGSGSLSYQWYFNGQPITGATGSSFDLSNIQFTNAGLYSVVVSSTYGSVTNAAYQVVVNPANIALGTFPGVYITGTVGYNYTIQSTTNLADTNAWVTLTNLTLATPIQIWDDNATDITLPANPKKFYRVLPGQ